MTVQIDWLVPNTVILIRHSGAMTEEEIVKNSDDTIAMINSSDAKIIHVIIDSTAVTTSPPLPAAVRVAKAAPKHEREGWIITVGGQNPVVKFVMSVSRSLLKVRTQNYETLMEAIAFLKTMDETLDWSQARMELISS
ncbi:MAG: hypothetical protein KC519_07820 [Anaerolineae bacterium]|nr:hypothetical protein [Anaerolineae bacterium]